MVFEWPVDSITAKKQPAFYNYYFVVIVVVVWDGIFFFFQLQKYMNGG